MEELLPSHISLWNVGILLARSSLVEDRVNVSVGRDQDCKLVDRRRPKLLAFAVTLVGG